DAWAAAGNRGWSYADVLPYFLKSENNARGGPQYHGRGGPLHVGDLRSVNPLTRAFLAGAREQGIAANDDFNGADQAGAGLFQVTQRGGRRWSAADAFLRPALRRPNLTLHVGAHVARVLFEGTRASGIAFKSAGTMEDVRASKEVILAAGAVGSPQILMLSGVGPAEHLRRLNVPVVLDLPGVGANLQDHPMAAVIHACTRPISLAAAESPRHLANFLFFRRGPLTSCVAEAVAFIKTGAAAPVPDV